MQNKMWLPGLFAVVFAHLVVPLAAADRLSDVEIETIQSLIEPTDMELKWTEIPWMVSLWDARVKAAREGKPIFLWQMDGHPLACV